MLNPEAPKNLRFVLVARNGQYREDASVADIQRILDLPVLRNDVQAVGNRLQVMAGCAGDGIDVRQFSPALTKVILTADVVLSIGQMNFEGLNTFKKDVYFLFASSAQGNNVVSGVSSGKGIFAFLPAGTRAFSDYTNSSFRSFQYGTDAPIPVAGRTLIEAARESAENRINEHFEIAENPVKLVDGALAFLGADKDGRDQEKKGSFETHLPRIRLELEQSGLDENTVEAIYKSTYENLKEGKYFIRPDVPVRIVVFGFEGIPLVGPLPPGKTVNDLTRVGDFDYAVVHSAAFWFGSVFVVAQTPDQKMVTLFRPQVPYKYHWTIPSRVLEPGREIPESAADEVKEELGLEAVDHARLEPVFKVNVSHTKPNKPINLVSVFKYRMNDYEVQQVLTNQRVLASIWESRGLSGLIEYLDRKARLKEGGGEAAAFRILTVEEFADENKVVPEIRPILHKGFGISDDDHGRATAVRWLKGFEKIGALLSGEVGRERWGKAYKDFAATVELSSAFAVMLVGLGGTLVLAGAPLGWAVAPLLGAVFGWRFYRGHFLRPGESDPVTPVNVSFPKAFIMAAIYGILISITPLLLGFGPDSLAYFSPVLAETLWGSAAGLHLFFDRKTSAAREGTLAARHFIDQLSTVPGAFDFINPIIADRTNQLLNSGPFSPDLADQTLRRLKNDPEFRAGFLNQIRSAVQDNQLSPLQLNLLSALLASTGEPLGIVHFLGTDPEKELDRIEGLVSPSVHLTVVAPIEQSPTVWQRTEALKTRGVNVVRKNSGGQGWTERQLTELEKEMSAWLRSVPSALLATVGPGVEIDPAEIDRLGPDSRLKPALAAAVGLLVKTLELYFHIHQAVQSSA